MNRTVGEIAEAVHARVIGDNRVEIKGVASVSSAKLGDLVFVEDEKHLRAALESNAHAVVAGKFAENARSQKPMLISGTPRLAFARAAAMLQGESRRTPGIDASAVVLPSANVSESAIVDPWTFIGENASVGARSWVGAG